MKLEKLKQMIERDHEILNNLEELKGAQYAQAASAMADLLAVTSFVVHELPKEYKLLLADLRLEGDGGSGATATGEPRRLLARHQDDLELETWVY